MKSVYSKENDEACLGFVVKIFTKSLHRGGVPPQQDFQTFRHPWYGNFPDTCCKRIFYDFRGFPSFSLNLCSAPAFIYLINGHACLSLIYLNTHFYVKGYPYSIYYVSNCRTLGAVGSENTNFCLLSV